MTDRVRTAALAGALITMGCIVAALGSFALLSAAFCPPLQQGAPAGGCVPAYLIPWYGLVLTAAIAGAGAVVAAVGVILYRRARSQPAVAARAPE